MDASRKRKRYLRGSTFKKGQGWPFTWITSPYKEVVSAAGEKSEPEGVYCLAERIRGMSVVP